ncbi:MAG TPA: general secretion pathway protein GspB [Solimonas sp.]|nr:general secretion pathway protein GspB [Solimonas sp.]
MSYILDALRRAERERDTGKAPSVESLNRAPPNAGRSRVPASVWALAIATALIATAALVVLLWPRNRVAPPPATQAAAAGAVADTVTADRPAMPAPAATAESGPAAIDDSDVASLDDVTGDDSTGGDDAGDDARSVTPSEPVTDEPAATADVPDAAASAITPPAPAPTPAAGDQDTIAVPPGVTVLREMPTAYREQFPVRTFGVHVYDPDPAKRWIMVDGQRYREGDTLASGPQIVEIVEGGVIFDYQGARVLLPIR